MRCRQADEKPACARQARVRHTAAMPDPGGLVRKGSDMSVHPSRLERWIGVALGAAAVAGLLSAFGCARLPYTTRVVHEDPRVRIVAQREVEPVGWTHPVQLGVGEIAHILQGFSIRESQRLPLRWFAEEVPPKPLFRADEIAVLAPALANALATVGPDERVHFELIAPGMNPSAERDVVAGWIAVRDPYLYLVPEYFHVQIPTRKSDLYDYNYPTPPPAPKDYLLYFEPGRYWIVSEEGQRALEYREFLKVVPALGSGESPSAPSPRNH